jgi:hypothetical protein
MTFRTLATIALALVLSVPVAAALWAGTQSAVASYGQALADPSTSQNPFGLRH